MSPLAIRRILSLALCISLLLVVATYARLHTRGSNAPTSAASAPSERSVRRMLTYSMYSLPSPIVTHDDKLTLNDEPPTSMVSYVDRERGFAVKIPYNPNWGNQRLYVLPFEDVRHLARQEPMVVFGPLLSAGSGSVVDRFDSFTFVSRRTIDQILQDYSATTESGMNLGFMQSPKVLTVGGLHAVEYRYWSTDSERIELTVICPKYNIIFRSEFPEGWRNENYLKGIANTIVVTQPRSNSSAGEKIPVELIWGDQD